MDGFSHWEKGWMPDVKSIHAIHLRNNVPVDVGEPETQPLNLVAFASATAFASYLKQFDLDPLEVASAVGVRYVTIWNIQHGNPITKEHAALVRTGLSRLTGVGYTTPIAVFKNEDLGM